jgi:3-hydroxyisobutyrate dehydrogenase-like beta-hydroxyacid dehydrogenase
MKVAFIGLGNMGTPLARLLLRAGHQLTVWNRTLANANRLQAEGANVGKSAAEAAREAEAVITMLADDPAVETTVLAPGGIIEHLPKNAVHISMSTISVALSKRLGEEHQKRGQAYLAAPVFGRPEAAEAGKLWVVVAGEKASLERYKLLLEALGQRVFVMGDKPEMANVVKLSGNFLIASVIESLGEAIALTRKYGIDPQQYVEFLTSSLFAAPVYKTYGGLIAGQRYQPAGFKLRLGLKDMKLALAAAEAVDAPIPVASLLRDHMLIAIGRGMEDMDWSTTAKLAAENAGLE